MIISYELFRNLWKIWRRQTTLFAEFSMIHNYIQSVICKIINYCTSRLRIHHSYSYIETSPCSEGSQNFGLYIYAWLTAFEHRRNFIMQHLLWNRVGFCRLVQNIPTLVTLNNKPLGTEHLSNPDSNGHMGR